jgi:hypothetical protein
MLDDCKLAGRDGKFRGDVPGYYLEAMIVLGAQCGGLTAALVKNGERGKQKQACGGQAHLRTTT